MKFCRFFSAALLVLLLVLPFFSGSTPVALADEAAIGLSPEQIEEIREKVSPVLRGRPVKDLPDEDQRFLFMAEVLFPESFELFYGHGEFLAVEKQDYTQAIPRLKKALELKPKDLKSLELLATCYYALKEEAEEASAWDSLREILEDFDADEAKDLRERVMMQLGRMAHENAMIMRSGKRFIVYTPANSTYSYTAEELTDERLEEIYRQVTGDLECIPAFRTSIVVLTPKQFEEVKPTDWAGAFASSDKSMVLDAQSFPKSEPTDILPAKPILLHEYTHNIVFVAAQGRCPIWFNEGLAVYAETKDRDFTEFTPAAQSPGELMGIEELEKEFIDIRSLGKEDIARVRRAYRLAGLYTRFLIQSFTLAAPRQILAGLKSRIPFEQLLEDVSKMNVAQFEQRFSNWVAEMNN